ncbi:ADAM 17 protease-like [Tropilaelaps mercedesae]|uniref:ADAM 17 protease-like n=1 Tax=Tropilaelaps mercedesae TaxID=418985 RepID=A0A1V9XBF4_9ACAR|nr:ADAM 17 protease-like [Tropilaelaps mercedesae]
MGPNATSIWALTSRRVSCLPQARLLHIISLLIVVPPCSEVSDPAIKLPIADFGSIELRRASPITTRESGPLVASLIDNNIYHGFVDGQPDSRVAVFSHEDQFSGMAAKGRDAYEVAIRRSTLTGEKLNFARMTFYASESSAAAIAVEEPSHSGDPTPSGSCNHRIPSVLGSQSLRENAIGLASNAYCRLRLVADHTFFQRVGRALLATTRLEMSLLVSIVNTIFKETVFRDGNRYFTDIGFKVGNVTVFERPTGDPKHFNSEGEQPIEAMLASFAREDSEANARACGAVLFTARDFAPCNATGLAFTGSVRNDIGVCARPRRTPDGEMMTPNAVVVTAVRNKRKLATAERAWVLAHELGHLWGSEHDPEAGDESTWFIMAGAAGAGRRLNAFSAASVAQMSAVLKLKFRCFESEGSCGDESLDTDEFCDEGPRGGACCDERCRLRPGAECSDMNHACCDDCSFAPEGRLCRTADDEVCLQKRRCSGESGFCPPPKPMKDGAACENHGTCLNGVCQDFCKTFGLESCHCTAQHVCRICCMNDSKCQPTALALDDGATCMGGRCVSGQCIDHCTFIGRETCSCEEPDECSKCCLYDGVCRPHHGLDPLPEGSACGTQPHRTCRRNICTGEAYEPEPNDTGPLSKYRLIWLGGSVVVIALAAYLICKYNVLHKRKYDFTVGRSDQGPNGRYRGSICFDSSPEST